MASNLLTDINVNSSRISYVYDTTSYSTSGTSSFSPTYNGIMVVKLWGAGGGGNGGSGSYVTVTINVLTTDVYYVIVGYGGSYSPVSKRGDSFSGGYGSSPSGGGGTALIKFSNSTYTLLAVAGGGGIGNFAGNGNVLGGSGGLVGGTQTTSGLTSTGGNPGSNGVGGTGGVGTGGTHNYTGTSGSSAVITSLTLTGFGGTGSLPDAFTVGGGGGGYGGGGGGGAADNGTTVFTGGGAGGGGNYYNSSLVISGKILLNSGSTPPNTSDANYISGAGSGGSRLGNGASGLVVCLIGSGVGQLIYNEYGASAITDNLSGTYSYLPSIFINYIPTTTISSSLTTSASNSYGLYLSGPPVAGTNYTISNSYTLCVASGTSLFGGTVALSGGVTAANSSSIDLSGSSGAFKTTTGPFFRTPQIISSAPTLSVSSGSSYIIVTANTFTITLPGVQTSATNGLEYFIVNSGSGTITVSVANTSSETFNGDLSFTTLSLAQHDRIHIIAYTNAGLYTWYNF